MSGFHVGVSLSVTVALVVMVLPGCENGKDGRVPSVATPTRLDAPTTGERTDARAARDVGPARPGAKPPGKVGLIAFHAAWNPASRMQGDIVKKLAEEYEDKAGVRMVDVDTDAAAALVSAHAVKSCPAFVILADGKVVRRMDGLQSAAEIRAALDAVLRGE